VAVGSSPLYQQILKHLTQMKLVVSRLFATDEMKSAAREFVSLIASSDDDKELMQDIFLAGSIWYKTIHENS